MTVIKFKKLFPDARLPSYAKPGDAGMDVFAYTSVVIAPGERQVVATGIASEFSSDYVALVWDRSSLAVKQGIKTMAGVIDSGYRGEWKIALINLGKENLHIAKGDKIAQVILTPFVSAAIEEADTLSDSERGVGGFGSTGK
jgi:dUTP pyrophosphatase